MTTSLPHIGTLLGVWAHPDDEAYLSSGLMALVRRAAGRVVVATATRGEHGTPDPVAWPPESLAKIRERELMESLAHIDVHEHEWLGHSDGSLIDVPFETGVGQVAALLERVRPDTVVTFGPDGMTGHPDHQTVSAWVTEAWRRSGCREALWYATTTPAFQEQWQELHRAARHLVRRVRAAGHAGRRARGHGPVRRRPARPQASGAPRARLPDRRPRGDAGH